MRSSSSLEVKVDPDQVPLNPWDVSTLDDFLYYCCPECDIKEKDKQIFLEHALLSHNHAKHTLQLIKEGGQLIDPFLVKANSNPFFESSGNIKLIVTLCHSNILCHTFGFRSR